ncbi:hypothetical protein BS50DRAFT_628321 [Corynespora cassiicola Philippines]|uniref:Mediator of RNA polymerase II transcription subunit 13 n=1 Tax=Corynespora cassiicola Philippines TaxID=1448308 RepID=A0A2T2PCI6_CORCC|nr:hypothetical protein BS50DRAFT_628321 [Corynespora cassiicola Philippines]
MDFIKTCNTNAQAIGDFEAVAYHAFTVARNPSATSSKRNEWSPTEDIRAVEAELRQAHHLVVQDVSRSWLWLFQASTADKVGQKPGDLPMLEGYRFQREQYGVMKASELARPPPLRPTNPTAPPPVSVSSPSTSGSMKGLQGGGSRPNSGASLSHSGSDHQQQPHDSCAIYELFTSSVVALISYYLVRDHQAVALNYRTFVSKPIASQDPDQSSLKPSEDPYWLTDVHVYLTSSGTLVASISSLQRPEIGSLADLATDDEQRQTIGTCIRVAPNGLLAKVVSFDEPIDAATEDASQRLQRKRPKISPVEQGIGRWKAAVKRWLSWKGYHVADLDKRASWVKIRIAHSKQPVASSPALPPQSREVLWPRAFCYFYEDSAPGRTDLPFPSRPAVSQEEGVLRWFQSAETPGYKNPIDAAQQWFLGKSERDKVVEAKKRAKKIEEEAARPKEENAHLYPSSPLNSRTGAYGDLQAVSGVYPTPPDGIAPGTMLSSSDTPSVTGAPTNVILVPGGSNPGINLLGPQDAMMTDGAVNHPTSPDLPLQFDQFNSGGGNDDLFEDMDGDGFDGNGVTDADFNYFDEPDGDDVHMLDAPTLQDGKATPAKKAAKEKEAHAQAEPKIKEEISDPLAALEHALDTASRHPEHGSQEAKSVLQEDPLLPDAHIKKPSTPPQIQRAVAPSSMTQTKEPTPPLSPHIIQKMLMPSPKDKALVVTPQRPSSSPHRDSVFDPLSFNRKMSASDAKYQDGRFSFYHTKPQHKAADVKEGWRRPTSLRDLPLLTKLRYAIGVAATKGIPEVASLQRADSDFSDVSSETSSSDDEDEDVEADDLLSLGPEPLSASVISTAKRKLPTEGNATPMSTTSIAESYGGDMLDFAGLHIDESSLASFEPTPYDWSLALVPPPSELSTPTTRYNVASFSPTVPSMPSTPTSQPDMDLPDEKPLSTKDSIAVAEVVTSQITSTTLDLLHEDKPVEAKRQDGRLSSELRFHSVIKEIFPKASDCNVSTLAAIPDIYPDIQQQTKGQQRPPPRKVNEGSSTLGHHMYQINTPHVRVRRADILWDLLPPALAFWEPLGLAPCSPAKNVVSFCIYPHSDSLRPCVENFLVNIQIAYDNCKLGSHARVETIQEYEGGLVPFKVSAPTSTRAAFKSLRDTCIQFGKVLGSKYAQMRSKDELKIDAFVIYMVDVGSTPSTLWELCSAFWACFQAYGQGPPARPDQPSKPDLVLQIVPVKYIASFEVPVIQDSTTYSNLAREVYDRCPPSAPSEDKTPLSIYTAPSFQLEEAVPRQIPFKLTSEPPQDLLRENSYMHLAYATSLDGLWITAAWTDSCGKSQYVASYNLGTRIFGEIAKEIWQTTVEIMQARRVTWRVCVAKAGVMEREELETWVYLISCPTSLNLFVTVLTVDTHPHLKFVPTIPNPTTNPTTTSSTNHVSANTPGSTPQAGVSPDPHSLTPAATPSAEPAADPLSDPDARFMDATDETWGIILAHRLHNSNSTNEFRPCIISGLLVKRGDPHPESTTSSTLQPLPDPERGPIVVGINIVWIGAVGSTRAATSPFPPSASSAEGVSPGPGQQGGPPAERSTSSLIWTPTVQARTTAENLLKEILGQYRALGLLGKLKGIRGTRGGGVPWHVAVAKRGVEGLGRCLG